MYREETIKSLGPLTTAIDAFFTAIDKPTRDAYHSAYRGLRPGARVSSTENDKEELFPFRAVLINALTEEHTDAGDWKEGWAWLGVFGNFSGGDICLSQLGVRVPMPEESIVGLRSRELKHFIARWHGLRYSVVHFFKESLREHLRVENHTENTRTSTLSESGSRNGKPAKCPKLTEQHPGLNPPESRPISAKQNNEGDDGLKRNRS